MNMYLQPKRIGGWLILVAITLVISIFRILYGIFDVFIPLWANIDEVSVNLSPYSEHWYAFIVAEFVGNILFFLFTLYVTWLFFGKSYKTPKMFIIWDIAGFLLLLIDQIYWSNVFGTAIFDDDSERELGGHFIHCLIWVPYFLYSVRVKNTFVEGRPAPKKPDNLLVN